MGHNQNHNQQGNNPPPSTPELDSYRLLIRLAGVVAGLGLLVVSINFNNVGFQINAPGFVWVGIILSIAVTMIEVVFNEEGMRHSPTIIVIGLAAYAYGFYTNFIGILAGMGIVDIWAQVTRSGFAAVLAFILEVTPEALFMWGVTGIKGKDFLSNLLVPVSKPQNNGGGGGGKHGGGNQGNNSQQNSP